MKSTTVIIPVAQLEPNTNPRFGCARRSDLQSRVEHSRRLAADRATPNRLQNKLCNSFGAAGSWA